MPGETDLAEAASTASNFWVALANDDVAALRELLSEEWTPVPDDFAKVYRAARGITPFQCRMLNALSEIEELAPDRLRLRYTTRPQGPFAAGEPLVVWPLEILREEGRWLVGRTTPPSAT
ncbi:MAG TPA: hypothetical protein VM451_09475 [Candidatus Limnocylindria bacterium]|nr:hypothetical protein [Candidatus Limnocylindria bacterium]